MKVSELKGRELDYWVGKACGDNSLCIKDGKLREKSSTGSLIPSRWAPSINWVQGGRIIENMKPTSLYYWEPTGLWTCAWETALIAAMRCFVASKFGDEVDDS